MDANRSPFAPPRPASPGALLAASVLGLIGLAIFWAVGPRQTRIELEKCRAAYANAHTDADSVLVDSMHVMIAFPKRSTIFRSDGRCAELRARLVH